MSNKFTKVTYKKPSKWFYLKEILVSILNLSLIKDLFKLLAYYIVNNVVGRRRAQIGKNTNIHPTVILRNADRIIIGKNCNINHNNIFQAGKVVAKIIIGDDVHTGPNVMIFAFNHSIDDREIPFAKQGYYDSDVTIGNNVWIGGGVIILAGVTIGCGSVIASGAVVNKDVLPYSIVGGVPAKVLKMRK